jgi:hypothetical protein
MLSEAMAALAAAGGTAVVQAQAQTHGTTSLLLRHADPDVEQTMTA